MEATTDEHESMAVENPTEVVVEDLDDEDEDECRVCRGPAEEG